MVNMPFKVKGNSFKYVNGLRQEVKPFISIVEEKVGNEIILEYVIAISIVGHEKIIKWKARVRDYPMIVFLRELEMLDRIESINKDDIEPLWHLCRAGAENNVFDRQKISPLETAFGPEGFGRLLRIREEVLSFVPTPAEYETLISRVSKSSLSEGSKDILILLCREGKEFYE